MGGGGGYGINVLQQTACLVVGPVAVGDFAFLFGCTPVGRTSGSVVVPAWGLVCWWDGGGLVLWLFARPAGVCLLDFFCSGVRFGLLLGAYPCFVSLLCLGLCVFGGWCVDRLGVFHAGQISVCLDPHLN